MAALNSLNLNILGFPAVNRDLTVKVLDPLSMGRVTGLAAGSLGSQDQGLARGA